MTLPAGALAAGAGINVGANILTDAMHDEQNIYDKLCSIDDKLKALIAYNERERERTPYIAELRSDFVAGVLTAATFVPFVPASSFNIDHVIVSADVAANLILRMGTRGPRILYSPFGITRIDIPYHLNGGQEFSFQTPDAINVAFTGFVVGWYEQNRLGPLSVIGDDD